MTAFPDAARARRLVDVCKQAHDLATYSRRDPADDATESSAKMEARSRCGFTTMVQSAYACGLQINEPLHLPVSDIDSVG
jgi:hypothetical protein